MRSVGGDTVIADEFQALVINNGEFSFLQNCSQSSIAKSHNNTGNDDNEKSLSEVEKAHISRSKLLIQLNFLLSGIEKP